MRLLSRRNEADRDCLLTLLEGDKTMDACVREKQLGMLFADLANKQLTEKQIERLSKLLTPAEKKHFGPALTNVT